MNIRDCSAALPSVLLVLCSELEEPDVVEDEEDTEENPTAQLQLMDGWLRVLVPNVNLASS